MSAATPSPVPPAPAPRPGVGADVVDPARLAAVLARSPGLAERLFTPGERAAAAAARRPADVLALCFAAKEALLKALGRGLNPSGLDAALLEVEVRTPVTAPALHLVGSLAQRVAVRGQRVLAAFARAPGAALATVLLLPAPAPVEVA